MLKFLKHKLVFSVKVYSLFLLVVIWMNKDQMFFYFIFIQNFNKSEFSEFLFLCLQKLHLTFDLGIGTFFTEEVPLVEV